MGLSLQDVLTRLNMARLEQLFLSFSIFLSTLNMKNLPNAKKKKIHGQSNEYLLKFILFQSL